MTNQSQQKKPISVMTESIKKEFRLIAWPNKVQLFTHTKVVIFASLLAALIVYIFDILSHYTVYWIQQGLNTLISYFGG